VCLHFVAYGEHLLTANVARISFEYVRAIPVNALFYQFEESDLSVDSLARRLVIGLMSSLLVFIPTSAISILFRRVRPRKPRQDKAATDATPSTEAIELDDFDRSSLPHALVRNTSVASTHGVSDTKTPTTVAGSNDRDLEPETVAKADGIDNTPGNSATPPTGAATGSNKTGIAGDAMATAFSSEASYLEKPEVSPYMASTGGDKPTHTIVLNDYTDEQKRMSIYSLSSDSLKATMSPQVRPKLVNVRACNHDNSRQRNVHSGVHVCVVAHSCRTLSSPVGTPARSWTGQCRGGLRFYSTPLSPPAGSCVSTPCCFTAPPSTTSRCVRLHIRATARPQLA